MGENRKYVMAFQKSRFICSQSPGVCPRAAINRPNQHGGVCCPRQINESKLFITLFDLALVICNIKYWFLSLLDEKFFNMAASNPSK